jgi:3-hydroxybutyrate dehydrogenase
MVQTPLWTDHPEKMAQFGYNPNESLTADDVANYMVTLITDGQYPGGTCLETTVGGSRVLGVWNIEPPKALGTKVPQAVIEMNQAPIKALLKKERSLL